MIPFPSHMYETDTERITPPLTIHKNAVSFDPRGFWPHVLLVREPLQVGRARVSQVRPVQRAAEEALQEGRGVPLLHLEALRHQKRSVP